MGYWTNINGTVTVSPMGRTQAEKTYILNTVLTHLPKMTNYKKNMDIYVLQRKGYDILSNCDEFGNEPNDGLLATQSEYIVVVNDDIKDKEFEYVYKEFNKWLCRLAKRVRVKNVLIKITGYDKSHLIDYNEYNNPYSNMFERASWIDKDSKNWCEYLMWKED